MFCRKCGRQIEQDSEFCCYCGTKILANSVFESPVPKEDQAQQDAGNASKKKTWIWTLVAVIALSIIGFVIIGLKNQDCSKVTFSSTKATATPIQKWRVWLDTNDGIDPHSYVRVAYGEEMPEKDAPYRKGFVFQGYNSSPSGNGTQYYDSNMNSVHVWDKTSEDCIIYAQWTKVAEQKYSKQSTIGAAVYVDIMSFEPCSLISTSVISGDGYLPSDLVCKCKTANGSTVYLFMSLDLYQQEIDPTASWPYLKMGRFETIQYSLKRTVHGYVQDAEKLCKGLASQTDTKVIEVYQIDLFQYEVVPC